MPNANHVTPELVKAARERIRNLLKPGSGISKQAFVPMDQNGAAPPPQAAAPAGAAPGGAPAAPAPQGGPPPQDPAAGAGGPLPADAAGGGGAVQISANDLMSFVQQMMAQQGGGGGGAQPGAPAGAPGADGAPKKSGKGGDIAELKQMLTQMLDKLNVLLGWFAGMQGKDPSEAISQTGGGPVEPSLLGGTLGAPAAMGQPSEDPGGAPPEVPGLPPGTDPNSVPGGPPPPGMTVQAAMGTRNPPNYKAPVKTASEGLRLHELLKRLHRP